MFKKILNIFYCASLLFILTLTNLLILSSTLFIIKISISTITLYISFIVALLELYFIKKENIKNIILAGIVIIFIFLISIFATGRVYDSSYDGNAYHKEAIGLLKEGWNPIYETAKEYGQKIDFETRHTIWLDSYPKTTWIYGATVYKMTNNIETAKSFNLLMIFSVFFIILYLIEKFYNKKIFAITMAISVCTLPLFYEQMFSLYLDAFLGFVLLLIIIYMYLFLNDDKNKEYIFLVSSLIIIIVNIKFTGLFYAGLFCLGYYIVYFVKKIKSKEYKTLLKYTSIFVFVVLISILLVGSNSYVKNTVVHKNPLYPLIGEGKRDIMTGLQPASFDKMSAIKKNYYSIFSYSANVGAFNNGEPTIKKPFTKTAYEISQFGEDIRIGGFGVYFSGILLLSLIIIIVSFIIDIKNKNFPELIFLGIPFVFIIGIMFIIGESWWARYYPQLYFIPLMAIYLLLKNNKIFINVIGILLVVLCVYNSYIIAKQIVTSKIPISGETRMTLEKLENKELNIYMIQANFSGALFNLKDYNINYTVKPNINNEKDLYMGMIKYESKK